MRIAAFARDPGGANVLAPIIAQLMRQGGQVKLTGQDWALERFRQYGLKARAIASEELDTLVTGSDVVLTSTSWPPDAEWTLWQAAERANVPSLAVMDFWAHYRSRFFPTAGYGVYPTRIAAMDHLTAEGLCGEGVPSERIVITGQPFLEMRARDFRAEATTRDLVESGRILFASQPLSSYPGADTRGYDEFSVVRLVLRAVEAIVRQKRTTLRVVIRPHPKDDVSRLQATVASEAGCVVCQVEAEDDPDQSILRSQLVLGVNSMLLIEAALAGRPVISVQPGPTEADDFPLSRRGICPRVGTIEALQHAIWGGLQSDQPMHYDEFLSTHVGATNRVIEALCRLSGDGRSRRIAAKASS